MNSAVISVVIPTYDRPSEMLCEAVDSVLAQDGADVEIIVVDDGSHTPAAPGLASYGDRIRHLRQPNGGIGSARNAGLRASHADLIAFLDSDDVWMPGKLSRQLAVLEEHPEVDAVFGRAEQFHDPSLDEAARRRHPIKDPVVDAWLSTAMLIRRRSFDRVGFFTEMEKTGIDIDWFLRAREAGLRMEMLPEIVYRRRIHTTNISITEERGANHGRLVALKRSLDRRRQAEAQG
jgi:glycosyltransferase involved in cell wall biosynthesis